MFLVNILVLCLSLYSANGYYAIPHLAHPPNFYPNDFYVPGQVNVDACPPGTVELESAAECEHAAHSLGLVYVNVTETDHAEDVAWFEANAAIANVPEYVYAQHTTCYLAQYFQEVVWYKYHMQWAYWICKPATAAGKFEPWTFAPTQSPTRRPTGPVAPVAGPTYTWPAAPVTTSATLGKTCKDAQRQRGTLLELEANCLSMGCQSKVKKSVTTNGKRAGMNGGRARIKCSPRITTGKKSKKSCMDTAGFQDCASEVLNPGLLVNPRCVPKREKGGKVLRCVRA